MTNLQVIYKNRASAVLFTYLKGINFDKIMLIPSNICPIVPITLLKLGVKYEMLDIDKETLCLDLDLVEERIRVGKGIYGGVLFVYSFGKEFDLREKFKRLKSLDSSFKIIEDKCLCKPEFLKEIPEDTDLIFYSTGISKVVELGFGGYGYTKEKIEINHSKIAYDEKDLKEVERGYKEAIIKKEKYHYQECNWLDLREPQKSFDSYNEEIQKISPEILRKKKELNELLLKGLPKNIVLGDGYNLWRFNIKVDDRDEKLNEIFDNGAFASGHYANLSEIFDNRKALVAEELGNKVINIFNDKNVDREYCEKVIKIITKEKTKIGIIGANEYQYKLVEKANSLGYETYVFAIEEGAVAKDIATEFYPESIVEKEKILEKLKSIKPNAICTVATDLGMPTVNYIAKHLNLKGNSHEATEKTTNKYLMRKELRKAGLGSPSYNLVKTLEDLDRKNLEFPVIVKPIDRSGSRGITKVEKIEDLEKAVKRAQEVSFIDEVLVEEFVDGREFSIEGISQDGRHEILQITEKFTSGAPNFIERGHLQPARITLEEKNKIKEVVKSALKTLGIENGASHTELKIDTKNQIKIIEIGGRMGGDFIGSDMVELSTGIDYLKLVLDVSLGNKIKIDKKFNREKNVIVRFIFTKEDLEDFKKLKVDLPHLIKEYHINKEFNDEILESGSRNGYYILQIEEKDKRDEILKAIKLS